MPKAKKNKPAPPPQKGKVKQAPTHNLPQKGFYFVPLGGAEQFGVNLNVYICDGKILVVDCGLGFADERYPGIDLLLPDPAFLEAHHDKIQAIIITHAHEDHIGALAYLYYRIKAPIYCTAFTAAVMKEKFREAGIKNAKIEVVKAPHETQIGDFSLKFLPVAHSIPDSCALRIKTPHGAVLHSGDWNLDPAPVIGSITNPKHFGALGSENLIAYIGDSTNADVDGRAGSESEVAKGLEAVFRTCKGRIAVTMFSSNIGRIISIVRAAKAVGRDVGVVGRSLIKMVAAAKACGYLEEAEDFVSEKDLEFLPEQRTVIIMTGSQGEARSALAKAARGEHPVVRLGRGDTVIFSSRPIPGNEMEIAAVRNNLIAAGVSVISPRDTGEVIHVSGHPCRQEIADMLGWVKPGCVIPVHGERTQLEAHANFAQSCQIKHTILPSNGSMIRLAPGKPEIIDHVHTSLLAVDQKRIISSEHASIAERRKMQFTGIVHVSLVMDGRGDLAAEPVVSLLGLIDVDDKEEGRMLDQVHDEILDILEDMSWEERQDERFLTEELRIGIRRFFVHVLGLKPMTTVHLIRV